MKSLLVLVLPIFFILVGPTLCMTQESQHQFPRPLIVEVTTTPPTTEEGQGGVVGPDELNLECTSWRVAAEANNLAQWKTIPQECGDYVRDYVMGRGYKLELERVSNEAFDFVKSVHVEGDGRDVWVFDVDETLLSNLPYYVDHGFGLEVFDSVKFDKWVETGMASAIEPSLRLYEEVLSLGIKAFLLTGRNERFRDVTAQNLMDVGFKNWDKLILRATSDHGKPATIYKSEKRDEMVSEGYRILGNSGDQWTDLLGSSMAIRSFKLPNPMYYVP